MTRLLAAVLLPAAIAGVLVVFAQHLVPPPPQTRVVPNSVVWGDGVFPARPVLARWLARRGRSYEVWAKRHPSAAARLTAKRPFVARSAEVRAPARRRPRQDGARASRSADSPGSSLMPVVGALPAVLGLLLVVVRLRRAVPARVPVVAHKTATSVRPLLRRRAGEVALYVLAASVAVVLGAAIAIYLGSA